MIQLLFGDNDYARTQAERRIRVAFAEQHGDQSVAIIDGIDAKPADLPQLLQGQSLFADSKLIVLREASANKQLWEGLGDFLDSAGDVDLVLVETKPDKRTRTFKWLQAHAELHEAKLLDERTTISWCETEARRQGIDLSHELAAYLVHRSGTDQWRLYNDISKVALAGKPISRELIDQLVEPHPSASVFDLLDAITSGRRDEALRILRVVRDVEDPYKFMGLLSSQLYALAVCVTADHRPSAVVAKEAGLHPYVAQKTLALAGRLDLARVRQMIQAVDEADERLKSSGAEPWLIVETCVGTI